MQVLQVERQLAALLSNMSACHFQMSHYASEKQSGFGIYPYFFIVCRSIAEATLQLVTERRRGTLFLITGLPEDSLRQTILYLMMPCA